MAAMIMSMAAAATPPGNVEAIPPGNADLRPVGPEELRDFSIGEQPARPPAEQPQTQPQAQTTPPPRTNQPSATPAPTRQQPAPVRQAPQAAPQQAPAASSDAAPPSTNSDIAPVEVPPPPPVQNVPLDPPPASNPTSPLPGVPESGGISPLYWGLALLLAGLAGFAFLRQRRAATAGAAPAVEPQAPEPVAKPAAATPRAVAPEPVAPGPPVAAPPPPPAPPSDTVSITMKPELQLNLMPLRAMLTEQEFAIEYVLQIANRGNGPARKLGVDTAMIMAGPEQEQKIAQFIAHPPQDGPAMIETLNSFGQVQMQGTLRVPLAQMTIVQMEGRQLIMPTVVLYPKFVGGRGTPHRFVIGRKPTEGDKLAPMRADLGLRTWRDLEARKA